MVRVISSPEEFTVIGENIHATRVLLRKGRRVVVRDDGSEVVPFRGDLGEQRYLTVPDWFKKTQPYEQGQIKHFMIAMMKGINGNSVEKEEGASYIRSEVRKQIAAGASYIDINPDEVHYSLEIQKKAMRWAVEVVQDISSIPVSVDSSAAEIIEEGLEAYDGRAGRPIVNSVAPERPETLDMVAKYNPRVIIMSTSGTGMPQDAGERVENTGAILEQVLPIGVALEDIFVDAIIFPISVDGQNGNNYFDAVRKIREIYGEKIHIGMGLSNVSFGMPRRKLINQAFIHLALESGIDAGIIDPIQTKLQDVFNLDVESEAVKLALDMLLGRDDFCMNYIEAHRNGRLG